MHMTNGQDTRQNANLPPVQHIIRSSTKSQGRTEGIVGVTHSVTESSEKHSCSYFKDFQSIPQSIQLGKVLPFLLLSCSCKQSQLGQPLENRWEYLNFHCNFKQFLQIKIRYNFKSSRSQYNPSQCCFPVTTEFMHQSTINPYKIYPDVKWWACSQLRHI